MKDFRDFEGFFGIHKLIFEGFFGFLKGISEFIKEISRVLIDF